MLFRIITLSAAFMLLLNTTQAQTARGNRANRAPVDPRGKVRFPSDTMGYSSNQLPAGSVRYGSPEYYRDSASLNGRTMPIQQQYNAGQYQREGDAGTTGRTGINTANPAGAAPMGNQPSGLNAPTGAPTVQPGSQRPAGVTSPNPDGTPSPANPSGTGMPGSRPTPTPVDSNRTPRQ